MSKKVGNLLIIINLLLLTSCSELLTRRSFVDEMDKETDGIFVAGRDFEYVPGDSGSAYRSREDIQGRTPASRKVMERRAGDRALVSELKRRENALSPSAFSNYQKRKRYLDGISEQIYYLQLTRYERKEYLAAKMVRAPSGQNKVYDRSPLGLVMDSGKAEKNIFLGMNKNAVERSWGMPSRIDIAGNPRNQNERWTFYDGRRVRKIFFESGVVGGWSTD